MHIEFRHLRTIKAIHECGGLARAADQLNITQSALSHQIKGLEDQAGVELFLRRSKPMKLSAAGLRLLRLAEQILPQVEAAQNEFSSLRDGRTGRMHIAIECHACFEWLFPVLESFRKSGATLMSISAPVWPSTRFRPCRKKRSIWWSRPIPKTCRASNLSNFLIITRCLWPLRPIPRQERLYRGRGFSRPDPDHLSGGTHASGCVQPAVDPGAG